MKFLLVLLCQALVHHNRMQTALQLRSHLFLSKRFSFEQISNEIVGVLNVQISSSK